MKEEEIRLTLMALRLADTRIRRAIEALEEVQKYDMNGD